MEKLNWKKVEHNKWVAKLTNMNFLIVMINKNDDGTYELTYVDCELNSYMKDEIDHVKAHYGIDFRSKSLFALRISEHYQHYEWKMTCKDERHLLDELNDATSFDIGLLCKTI